MVKNIEIYMLENERESMDDDSMGSNSEDPISRQDPLSTN